MDSTLYLAQVFALVYIAVGLGMLLNAKYYTKAIKDMMNNSSVAYLGGAIALALGYTIVTFHNIWVKDWTVIITIIGWIAVVKGVGLLVFPDKFLDTFKGLYKKDAQIKNWGLVVLAIGLVLAYYGFYV